MLKNITPYVLTHPWERAPADLEEVLRRFALQPPTQLAPHSAGWLPVTPAGQFVCAFDGLLLICAGFERKVVPASTVRRLTDARADEQQAAKGFKPGRKARALIKDQVLAELLASAVTTLTTIRVLIDPAPASA